MVGRQSFLSGFRLELQQCIAGGKLFILKVTPLGKILTWAFVLVGNHQLWKSHPNFPNHRLPKCWNHHKNQLLAGAIRISKPQVFRKKYFLDLFFGGGGDFLRLCTMGFITILHHHHVGVNILWDCFGNFFPCASWPKSQIQVLKSSPTCSTMMGRGGRVYHQLVWHI